MSDDRHIFDAIRMNTVRIDELVEEIDALERMVSNATHSVNGVSIGQEAFKDSTDDKLKVLHHRITFLEDRMTEMESKTHPIKVNVTADTESLTAYVHRLETLINHIANDMKERLDVHRTDINALECRDDPARIDRLEQRISDCELAIGTDKLECKPQRDTSWLPYDANSQTRPVPIQARVVVMWRNGEIQRPQLAGTWDWTECSAATIVAWRYAKEGE